MHTALNEVLAATCLRFWVHHDSAQSTPLALKHEVAHALKNLSRSYGAESEKITPSLPHGIREGFFAYFHEHGYAKEVWEDEMQAHLGHPPFNLVQRGIRIDGLQEQHNAIRALFKKTHRERPLLKRCFFRNMVLQRK